MHTEPARLLRTARREPLWKSVARRIRLAARCLVLNPDRDHWIEWEWFRRDIVDEVFVYPGHPEYENAEPQIFVRTLTASAWRALLEKPILGEAPKVWPSGMGATTTDV